MPPGILLCTLFLRFITSITERRKKDPAMAGGILLSSYSAFTLLETNSFVSSSAPVQRSYSTRITVLTV